jgi:hypothetical protein
LDRIGKNDYPLDLPRHLRIHGILNINNLKLFEPSFLEETVTILHPVENISDFQHHLFIDKIMDSKDRATHQPQNVSYLVDRQGQTLTQAKWMTTETMKRQFPKLLTKVGMLLDLTREEFDE